MDVAVERRTTGTLNGVEMHSLNAQVAKGAKMLEYRGEGNMNNVFGNGNNYNVESGGIANAVAHNSGNMNFYTSAPISPRDTVDTWLNSFGDMRAYHDNCSDYGFHERIIQDDNPTWLLSDETYEKWSSVPSESAHTTSPNVLWLYGDAGFGKSVLCAHAIRQQSKSWTNDRDVAVTYQFYKMSNESESPITAYLNFAEMLFKERFPPSDDKVPDEIMDICACSPNQYRLFRLVELLVREFKAVYIFVDGLDEMVDAMDNTRWSYAKSFLQFILKLAVDTRSTEDDFDTVVKVWISSQWRKQIHHTIFSRIPDTSTVSTSRSSSSIPPLVQIPLTETSNQADIRAMFRRELPIGRSYDFAEYEGTNFINRVLEILQPAVKGNFLWARLMLDSIANASSPNQVIEAFEKVPDDFGTYLGNRIQAQLDKHPESRRRDAAHILSCLMYARRPILVDELCEAVCASRIAKPKQNMREEDKPFNERIEEICAPLVRVDQMTKKSKSMGECTLYHSAVRDFLRDNPNVLVPAYRDHPEFEDEEYTISPRVLGRACMRYLQQKRYKHPLLCPPATQGRGFLTSCADQQDIKTHAFLTYCAKYWARHHEYQSAYSETLCKEIEAFVCSSNFRTTLQVQSLFVEARFRFMISTGNEEHGRHLVRAFPRFFTEQFMPGMEIQKQYNEAIDEFGYYLDSHCSFRGHVPGQIDRCFWGLLGSSNLFQRMGSHWRGFKLETADVPEDQTQCLYHDNMDIEKGKISLFSVISRSIGKDILRIQLELFIIQPGHKPKNRAGKFDPITVAGQKLELYQRPLRHHFHGRPRVVFISADGSVLRIGSEVFVSDQGFLRRLELEELPAEERMEFFEEISNRGPWVAIARRRKITFADLAEKEESSRDRAPVDINGEEEGSSSDGFSVPPLSSSTSESDINDEHQSDTGEGGPAFSGQASGQEQPPKTSEKTTMEIDNAKLDVDSVDHTSAYCSARESCSLRSTSMQSDEIGQDDDFWNDWFSDDDDLHIRDIDDGDLSENSDEGPIRETLDDSFDVGAEADDEQDEESDIPSRLSGVESEEEWSDSDDISDGDPAGVIFHGGRRSGPSRSSKGSEGADKRGTTHTCELLVLSSGETAAAAPFNSSEHSETDNAAATVDARSSLRVFRLVRKATGLLFSSPPAIHPTHNLVVWPLGGDEVLFAHFSPTAKTFFTTVLGASDNVNMYHVSVQIKFSPCGEYLHIVCLDGDAPSRSIEDINDLHLRVSTYRLSRRKLVRSLPRLIYRFSCPLWPAWCSSEGTGSDGQMPVAPLPWTLTWDWNDSEGGAHVYACLSSPQLHVVRAPLFADVEAREWGTDGSEEKNDGNALPVFRNAQPVFLPRSALSRPVHFFPHHPRGSHTTKGPNQRDGKNDTNDKQRGKEGSGGKNAKGVTRRTGPDEQNDDPFVATVVISSEDACNEPGEADTHADYGSRQQTNTLGGGYRGRAQVAQLTKTQLGGWTRLRYSEMERLNRPKNRPVPRAKMETWRGQLHSKLEKFDVSDDCEIVPDIRYHVNPTTFTPLPLIQPDRQKPLSLIVRDHFIS